VVGKGNKERIVPVGLQAKRTMLNYIGKERLPTFGVRKGRTTALYFRNVGVL
jgi:site-specific recombinase XerD